MLSVLRFGVCIVMWEVGCGDLVLSCVGEVREGCGFCLWLFGFEWEEALLSLGDLWLVFCWLSLLVATRGCECCVLVGAV